MAKRRVRNIALSSLVLLVTMPAACSATPILVNLSHPLQPYDYVPPRLVEPLVPTYTSQLGAPESKLVPAAAVHLEQLFRAANRQAIPLILTSGYRPFSEQQQLFQQATARDTTQEFVAPPGFSEHQTGLAADVATENQFCAGQQCFMLTRAAAWLAINAPDYGFIIRYPRDKTSITGYAYEPWHLRYVGVMAADQMYYTNQTLEAYVQNPISE